MMLLLFRRSDDADGWSSRMQLSVQMPGNFPHVGLIQFSRPEVTITFDVDQNVARAQRLEQFETAASEQRLSAAAHLPFSGIGHIRREAGKYDWVPIQ